MSELENPIYVGDEKYAESVQETGQGWGVAIDAFGLGFDVFAKRKAHEEIDYSKLGALLDSSAEAKDVDAVRQGMVDGAFSIAETGIEGYNKYKINIEHWGKHIAERELSPGQKLTLKVADAYSMLETGVRVVDSLSKAIFGVSPVDELIKKPFFGNWEDVIDASQYWGAASDALADTAKQLRLVQSHLQSWEGEARKCFDAYVEKLAEIVESGVTPSDQMRTALELLAEIVSNAFDLIVSTVDQIIALLELVLGDCALGPFGWVAATVTIANIIYDAIYLFKDALEMINNITSFINDFQSAKSQIANISIQAASF